MSKIPTLNEMLKLYTKKDLWERIQQHIQTIDKLRQQLAEYESKENNSINSCDEMLKNCETCKLKECIGCEHTWTCVQDIKQQLEEKDKELQKYKINEFGDAICDFAYGAMSKTQLWKSIEEHQARNMVLEKQLAEKDKEIDRLNHKLNVEEP